MSRPTCLNTDRLLLTILDWYIWRPFGKPAIAAGALFFLLHGIIWIARAAR